jgi:hypothetical protein
MMDYPYLDHNAPAIIEEDCAKGTSEKEDFCSNTQSNTRAKDRGDMSRK